VMYAIPIDDIKQFIEKRLCVHLVLLIQSQILRNKDCIRVQLEHFEGLENLGVKHVVFC